jgi:amino acid transporter
VFWRIALFYVVSLSLVGLLVPYTDSRLLGLGRADTTASPFVISIQNAGIEVLPSAMNAVILVSVLSVGNSSVFGSSRTLAALADQGQAPKILSYIDRKGRPLVALGIAFAFGFIAYAADSNAQGTVLAWMIAVSALSAIFSWGSICLAHIRFRKAWRLQGHSLDELAFRSQSGVAGSWFGLLLNGLVLAAQFFVGVWPVGYANMTGSQIAQNFFLQYLAAPVIIVFYLAYKFWTRAPFMHCRDMDVRTGMRELNLPRLIAEENAERAAWPRWKKVYKVVC